MAGIWETLYKNESGNFVYEFKEKGVRRKQQLDVATAEWQGFTSCRWR